MFNNLIESSSHAQEYKRRGSFLLFTTATYAVLLVLGAVASIYAYDAHLEAQSTELELLSYIPLPVDTPPDSVISDPIRRAPADAPPARPTRIELIDSPSNPNNVPDEIGTVASRVPPAPRGAVIGPENTDPPAPSFAVRGVPGGTGDRPLVDMPDNPPPPEPKPSPVVPKVLKISKVLNSQALSLPRPNYPKMAIQIRVQGVVTVQVLIDESGKVVSAKAVSGHPLLVAEAQKAALQARFSPTIIGDQAVKVSGVITYNFVMQ